MAAILTNYNLAGGNTRSSSITSPTFLDLQVLLGTVVGRVSFYLERKQSTGDWIQVRKEDGSPIVFHTLKEVEDGISVALNGAASVYSVSVKPSPAATGTLTIDAATDGTIS